MDAMKRTLTVALAFFSMVACVVLGEFVALPMEHGIGRADGWVILRLVSGMVQVERTMLWVGCNGVSGWVTFAVMRQAIWLMQTVRVAAAMCSYGFVGRRIYVCKLIR